MPLGRDGLAELALGNSSLLGATAADWEAGARLSSMSAILPLVGSAGSLAPWSPAPSVIFTHISNTYQHYEIIILIFQHFSP